MEGDVITDARQDFGQFNGSPEVSMTMNAEGARAWKRLTGENIGKKRCHCFGMIMCILFQQYKQKLLEDVLK